MAKPEVRSLGDGAWVVDYGRKWFRLRPNGEIIAREVYIPPGETMGYARTREPTKTEVIAVRKWVAAATSAMASDNKNGAG